MKPTLFAHCPACGGPLLPIWGREVCPAGDCPAKNLTVKQGVGTREGLYQPARVRQPR